MPAVSWSPRAPSRSDRSAARVPLRRRSGPDAPASEEREALACPSSEGTPCGRQHGVTGQEAAARARRRDLERGRATSSSAYGIPVLDHRHVAGGSCWKLVTGAPRRDLSERYGSWKSRHDRLRRRTADGTWYRLRAHVRVHTDGSRWNGPCTSTPAPSGLPPVRLTPSRAAGRDGRGPGRAPDRRRPSGQRGGGGAGWQRHRLPIGTHGQLGIAHLAGRAPGPPGGRSAGRRRPRGPDRGAEGGGEVAQRGGGVGVPCHQGPSRRASTCRGGPRPCSLTSQTVTDAEPSSLAVRPQCPGLAACSR